MILALDVGNSQIYGGVFDRGTVRLRFRKTSKTGASSDEAGLFLRSVLRENGVDPERIERIAICSVVPEANHSLVNACRKYFNLAPFLLAPGVATGLTIGYRNPHEIGADRIANAIAAVQRYPQRNLIVIDLGTATTFCAISKTCEYQGGAIVAGLRLCMEALETRTSKLPSVEIVPMRMVLGRTTVESLQSGLYFGHLGTMKEIVRRLGEECFDGAAPFVIGTGGFSTLFESEKFFDTIEPDLVLHGLVRALQLNS